jgi:hypothetical protein
MTTGDLEIDISPQAQQSLEICIREMRKEGWSEQDVRHLVGLSRYRTLLHLVLIPLKYFVSIMFVKLTDISASGVSAVWVSHNRELRSKIEGMKDPTTRNVATLMIELNDIGLESVSTTRLVDEKAITWHKSQWNLVRHPSAANLERFLLSEHDLSLALANDAKVWIRKYEKEKELRQALEEVKVLGFKDLLDVVKAFVIDYWTASHGMSGFVRTIVEVIFKVPKIFEYLSRRMLASSSLKRAPQLTVAFQKRHELTLNTILRRIEGRGKG